MATIALRQSNGVELNVCDDATLFMIFTDVVLGAVPTPLSS